MTDSAADPRQPVAKNTNRRGAVKRVRAQSYLLWTLVALATSVIVTRTYLQLTGYPQIGGGDLHIAHAIWGGLLLYIAALVPLIFANNRALVVSAILNGVGAGLFIDEIGKFLTRTNDYFYPPAAPLVYSFFLLSVLLYFLVRKARPNNPRAELFRGLELLQDLVDGNLEQDGVQRLRAQMDTAAAASDPAIAQLGDTLGVYLKRFGDDLESTRPDWLHRMDLRVEGIGRRVGRRTHRIVILVLLLWGSLLALLNVALLVLYAVAPTFLNQDLASVLVTEGELRSLADWPWFITRLILEGAAGILTIAAAILLLMRRELQAIKIAIFAVVLSLTTVVLLTFYIDQFGAMYGALLEFLILLILISYQRWYLEEPA